jgi:hypothetical protein
MKMPMRLLIAVGILTLLGGIVSLASLWILLDHRRDHLLLNLAGRQRTLIQRMVTDMLVLERGSTARHSSQAASDRLHKTLDLFDKTHKAFLSSGWTEMGIIRRGTVRVYIPAIIGGNPKTLRLVSKVWKNLRPELERLRKLSEVAPSDFLLMEAACEDLLWAVDEMVDNLQAMAESKVMRLLVLVSFGGFLALGILVYSFIQVRIHRLDDSVAGES